MSPPTAVETPLIAAPQAEAGPAAERAAVGVRPAAEPRAAVAAVAAECWAPRQPVAEPVQRGPAD